MVIESEEAAARRGHTPYARILGWGQGTDGHHVAMSHPEGDGLARSMTNALSASGVKASEVEYINAHATSTPVGDISEIKAIKSVFGTHGGPAISSTKALTGHALSLSSVMEAGFTVLSLNRGFMPGSAHIDNLDPEAKGLQIIQQTQEKSYSIAMSNSSGFGGANVSVLFSKI